MEDQKSCQNNNIVINSHFLDDSFPPLPIREKLQKIPNKKNIIKLFF